MDKSYFSIANSPGMWAVCAVVFVVCAAQAIVFVKKSYRAGLAMNLHKRQLHAGMRSAAITAIGPSCSVMIGMMSLIVSLGGPMAWQRCSIVGSVQYELSAAQVGATINGTVLGAAEYGAAAWVTSFWICVLGAAGWLLIVGIFCPQFDRMKEKLIGNNLGKLSLFSSSTMVGLFAYLCSPYAVDVKNAPNLASFLGGVIIMLALSILSNRLKNKRLKEWSLGISMVAGMLCAIPFL
ncbi:MAG: DUF5058 family protein [Christensenellaceae bacterium]|jgi:hypothetical protein|nr:DUF5058 family protein [Christensenellaceae bacterium]